MRGSSRYNIITKLFIKEIVEWILSHPNIKTSCVSSDVVTDFNPDSNMRKFSKRMNGYFC